MTNFDKILSMDKKAYAQWLADNVEYDYSPWERWFSENFCDRCESVMIEHESWNRVCSASYCEIHEKCRFFPEMDHSPTIAEGIEMWLDEEVEENESN